MRPSLALAAVTALLTTSLPALAGTVSYNATLGSLPEAQGWTRVEGGALQPTPTVSGGVLHQGLTDVSGHQYWSRTDATFDFSTDTVTVDMRLHIVSSSFNAYPRGGYTVFLSDHAGRFASLYLASGQVFLGNDTTNSTSSLIAFDTTDAFHDYHLVIGPTGSSLSIDSTPIVSLALGVVSAAADQIAFGDGTVLAQNESNLISFTVSGVTVANVPEPASVLLYGLGLGGLAWLRRRPASA